MNKRVRNCVGKSTVCQINMEATAHWLMCIVLLKSCFQCDASHLHFQDRMRLKVPCFLNNLQFGYFAPNIYNILSNLYANLYNSHSTEMNKTI